MIGVVLAFGSPPDHVADVRPIARRPRNAVLGAVLVAALAVVILQPQLSLPLVTLFGLDGSGLAVTCLAVVALALPLAMADAKTDDPPTGWFLLTRRNLILSLTVLVVVADWYGARGLSLLPIGVLVLTLPLIIGLSRIFAARRQRLEYGLLRQPLRAGLGPQRLQLGNVVLLCALLALTVARRGLRPRSPPTHPRPTPRTPGRVRARSGRLRAPVPWCRCVRYGPARTCWWPPQRSSSPSS